MAYEAGARLGSYEILASLGAGGQGEVYRARDTKLDREVAVKVLPESLATDEFLQRFEREAKAVAALSHPNILAIYDFGKEGGTTYAVMELLEGETLRARLEQGALGARKAVELAAQCCSGLAAAHDKSIVHRDLKPENLFLTRDGQIKILDFGLAKVEKLFEAEEGEENEPTRARHTLPGSVLGTIGYMSPEQVRGQEADHRSDLFALGAVLYEMLSGERPFQRNSAADTISAILKEDPPDLSRGTRDIPPRLGRIVDRCLEKDPAHRFQSARDVRFALETISDAKPISTKQPDASGPAIAVLPFTDMSPKKDQEYFCQGMAEEILNALSKVPELRVAARSSAFQFGGKAHDVKRVGEALGVSRVLEGSVRTAGNRLRVSVQLVNVSDGYQLWSDRYEGDMEDVFGIQDEISSKIVEALRGRLDVKERKELSKRATENVRAYHLYLRGRHAFERRYRGGPQQALPFFEQAVKEDPGYALAHAGIGDCYTIYGLYGFIPPEQARQKVLAAAGRALENDESLAEAHTTLGRFWFVFNEWDKAEREFQRAVELNPSDVQAHCWYALELAFAGRHDEAAGRIANALALDPLSPYVSIILSMTHLGADRTEEAISAGEKSLELEPDFSVGLWTLGLALGRAGRTARAVELLERIVQQAGRLPLYVGYLGWAYGLDGRTQDARRLLAELEERASGSYVAPLALACIHAGLGESERVFHYIDDTKKETSPLLWLQFPCFDSVRSDPRFVQVIESLRKASP